METESAREARTRLAAPLPSVEVTQEGADEGEERNQQVMKLSLLLIDSHRCICRFSFIRSREGISLAEEVPAVVVSENTKP